MEKEDNPDIHYKEDVAIVLHFTDDWYNYENSYNRNNLTQLTRNFVKNNISFNDHMIIIEKIFKTTAEKKIPYLISAYLIASHSKHILDHKDAIAPSTQHYFDRAAKKINTYHKLYYHQEAPDIKFYRIFYKPSYISDEPREQNDIALSNAQIKIVDKAMIDLQRRHLDLTMSNNMTTTTRIDPLHLTQIKEADKVILDIQPDTQSIFLMDV